MWLMAEKAQPEEPAPAGVPAPEAQDREPAAAARQTTRDRSKAQREIGGPKGPEPTRYGDWQYNGRCTDF
jgi:hypothetical protein